MKQIKLKNMLNENTPGYKDRKFGDKLPTLEDIQTAYENKEESPIEEGDNTQYAWGQINKALMKYGMSPRNILEFLLVLKKI